jgi:hypothetical protein
MNNKKLESITDSYNSKISKLPLLYKEQGGGAVRGACGSIFETFVLDMCSEHNISSLKNDYKSSKTIDSICISNLQVDKHLYKGSNMVAALEVKTYLDLSMLKRAIFDFIELNSSPDVPTHCTYGVVMGQMAMGSDSLQYYSKLFHSMVGKNLYFFVLNKEKTRNSKKPIYKEQYRENFEIDIAELEKFEQYLSSL